MSSFDDLDAFVAARRQSGLALHPDGTRLVTVVTELAPGGTAYTSALWELDPAGVAAPRRLTRSAAGESSPVFTPDGDLLFVSGRSGAEPRLWRLPAAGGEAEPLSEAGAGVSSVDVAARAGSVVVTTEVPETGDAAALRAAREAAGVSARLHTSGPARFFDRDLGPGHERVHLLAEDGELRDLGPVAGPRLYAGAARVGGYALHPDGTVLALVVECRDPSDPERAWRRLELLDVATGARTVVADEPGADQERPVFSRDGEVLFWVRERHAVPGRGEAQTIREYRLGSGVGGTVAGDREWTVRGLRPGAPGELFVVADEAGHAPVFRVDDAGVTRLTRSGAYADVVVTHSVVYAMRSGMDAPPTPVRLDPRAPDQEPTPLRGVTRLDPLPGTLTEVTATAADGTGLRAWLVLPGGASATRPAPLLLWIHGGPLGSWNAWSWRWNPWLAAARGYAVLLPDPRLSTGYGQAFVDAATGAWGELPYTDLMTITDAALARADLDATRTGVMGGSFGGYMANWVAGHTDRFAAIVTHAGMWALDAFVGTTDRPLAWTRELGDCGGEHSPHRHIGSITTPMLVIHGDKDYRVPIGEGMRLWNDLQRHGVESQFLHYPDENHWILRPGDTMLWYRTVFAFLDHHVLGAEWVRPDLV